MLARRVEDEIRAYLSQRAGKILFVWGPRRSGKTTVLKKIAGELGERVFNFDLLSDREPFVPRREELSKLAAAHKVILIDEVQSFAESTVALKGLIDNFDVRIVATGSSELRKKSQEFDSLAGRFKEVYCLPLSVSEIGANSQFTEYEEGEFYRSLARRVQVWGAYPEVYVGGGAAEGEKMDLLQNILDTYVVKDIVDIYELKNAKLAKDVLTKVALQLGSEVSVREIANSLQASVATVANYIEIFIRNYVLIALPAFKTNMRRAVSENRKLYFYDLGIRNALVRDFRPVDLRPDKSGVWKNLVVSELEKVRRNENLKFSTYFYREYGGKEVDVVLESYKKDYVCWEVKFKGGRSGKVFPLPHNLSKMTEGNYYKEIGALGKTFG